MPSISGYQNVLVAVAGGQIRWLADKTAPWNSPTLNTGVADPPLNTSGLVFSAPLNNKLYFADGTNWRYFDKDANTVYTWAASAGTLPTDSGSTKPRLICTWRGRIVLSGLLYDPTNWFMSAQLDATNFDYSPLSITPTQAVAGNTGASTSTGRPTDTITSLCPYSEDMLIFFCDHSIFKLRGDPAAGGQLDRVTDAIGCCWGQQSWCIDPDGAVWFLSNRCRIYRMAPDGLPVPMSTPIDYRLSGLELDKVTARLQWDDSLQGLFVGLSHLDAPTATVHYFWEKRTGAWWPMSFTDTGMDPLCVCVYDGPAADDRFLLTGCWDGYVRAFDPAAADDDGTAISSYVWLGPLLTKTMADVRLDELQVALGANSGAVAANVHVGRTPEEALAASSSLSTALAFTAGRSFTQPVRRAGHAVYVRLSSTARWAFEQCRASVVQLGMIRARDN